ncbi:cell division protein ZipA [Halomonas sp. 328]|uniref:cell division protein ZipA n=1 Tax=Halomonas sp. 328 TaxID=2776704 RepID=UPI0018A76292|nr:cell division protein ZipA [Halomonas sp. 328]MBF8222317.1 cell division protein ZipA [Halomonas sp. 328]
MELREWLIILGLALVTLIVIDGVRRLQRQRRVPRLDRVDGAAIDDARGQEEDPEAAAREAELNWELPNGGARVVRPASYESESQRPAAKPKLTRQEHPGPSRVLAEWQAKRPEPPAAAVRPSADAASDTEKASPASQASEPVASPGATRGVSSAAASGQEHTEALPAGEAETPQAGGEQAPPQEPRAAEPRREPKAEPSLSLPNEGDALSTEPTVEGTAGEAKATPALVTDPADHDPHADDERYRLVDFDGMADSFKSGSVKMGQSMQRFGAGIKKGLHERREQNRQRKQERERQKAERAAAEAARRQQQEAERKQQEAARREAEQQAAERRRLEQERQAAERRQAAAESEGDAQDPLFTFAGPSHRDSRYADDATADAMAEPDREPEVRASEAVAPHPVVEKALRNDVEAPQAREALSHAEEVIVISVMCREEQGFSGTELLKLMLACGLRYSREMGIFHRFETEAADSPLQFSMVNVVKPGTFPLNAMDEFATPGITFLMPLPGAEDTSAAFEAMVECAMVVVRHLGGELKDENHSVMTAQTVEFARQKVHEFERRHRLQRYQVN